MFRPGSRVSRNSRSHNRNAKKPGWDDRFSIERMPVYNPVKDKYCNQFFQFPRKKPMRKGRKGDVMLAPGRVRRR